MPQGAILRPLPRRLRLRPESRIETGNRGRPADAGPTGGGHLGTRAPRDQGGAVRGGAGRGAGRFPSCWAGRPSGLEAVERVRKLFDRCAGAGRRAIRVRVDDDGVQSLATRTPPRPARRQRPDWPRSHPGAKFQPRRSCGPSREESNDGTHETKSALLRRRRMGPESGEGVPRSEDRHLPDRVARERAKAHPVAETPRLASREAAGGLGCCRLRDASAQREGGGRARAAHPGEAV